MRLLAVASLVLLAAACGGRSDAERLSVYFGRVQVEQSAYRHAQKGALRALDFVDKTTPTAADCRASARLMGSARDRYSRLGSRMRAIEAPSDLRGAHRELARSLQLYARFFDELEQVIGYCDALTLTAASGSPLPDRARELRADWRLAVVDRAVRTGVSVPDWAREVGVSPGPSGQGAPPPNT